MMVEAVTAGQTPSRLATKSFAVYILGSKSFRP